MINLFRRLDPPWAKHQQTGKISHGERPGRIESWADGVASERDRIQAERRQLRREYGEVYDRISGLLFAWDPKGINFGDNTDEYEPEVDTILPRLRTCTSPGDVQRVVFEEFRRWFGDDEAGQLEMYERIGRDIWAAVQGASWLRTGGA